MRITKRFLLTLGLAALAVIVFAACQSEPETVEVVVTRVVTETVEVEGETMEVTRLVEVPVEVEVTAEATEAPPEPEEPQILRIGGRLDDWLVDPEQPSYVTVGMSWNNVRIFEGLTRMDENYQVQPELASGIISNPFAGMKLIQQPVRCPAKCRVPMSFSRS